MDYSKFDSMVDLEGLKADIEDAKNNGNTYEEIPTGQYEVKIDKMELKESKKGDPMVAIRFRILNGDYENSCIFMNQVITKGFQIHLVNEFLRSLDTLVEVEFESYEKYANLLMDIMEEIDGKKEYALEYGETTKGFKTFEITEIFELED